MPRKARAGESRSRRPSSSWPRLQRDREQTDANVARHSSEAVRKRAEAPRSLERAAESWSARSATASVGGSRRASWLETQERR